MALQAYADFFTNNTPFTADATNTSVGGVDVSQCMELFSVEWSMSSNVAGTLRRFSPLRIRKRTSGNTPELWRASLTSAPLDGTIRMFDTNPADGSTRERWNLEITNATVTSFQTCSPDTSNAATASMAMYDLVEIMPTTAVFRDLVANTEHTWSWVSPS